MVASPAPHPGPPAPDAPPSAGDTGATVNAASPPHVENTAPCSRPLSEHLLCAQPADPVTAPPLPPAAAVLASPAASAPAAAPPTAPAAEPATEPAAAPAEGAEATGPKACVHCRATKTPLWRNGPAGPKTLCNACGVRHKLGKLLPSAQVDGSAPLPPPAPKRRPPAPSPPLPPLPPKRLRAGAAAMAAAAEAVHGGLGLGWEAMGSRSQAAGVAATGPSEGPLGSLLPLDLRRRSFSTPQPTGGHRLGWLHPPSVPVMGSLDAVFGGGAGAMLPNPFASGGSAPWVTAATPPFFFGDLASPPINRERGRTSDVTLALMLLSPERQG